MIIWWRTPLSVQYSGKTSQTVAPSLVYRLLAYTTKNDEILIKVLAHPRVPYNIVQAYLIRYNSHGAS
jgi:hypothetical protein